MAAKKTSSGSKSGKGTSDTRVTRDGAPKKKPSVAKAGGASDSGRPRIRSSHSGPSLTGESRPRRATSSTSASASARGTSRRDPTHAVPRPKRLTPTSSVTATKEARDAAKKEPRPKKTLVDTSNASLASDEGRALATAIAVAALEKKAVGLEILDVAGRVDYADFLVLMTGRSDRQVVALAQGIEEALRKEGTRPLSIEGLPHASWVLMDFGDVVVHVFQDEARSLYDLEGLWMDARRIPVPVPNELLNQ